AVRDFLDNDGLTLCDTPIFTPAACEGTTTLFEVDYFGDEKAFLTQSGQLYNEAAASAFGRVYCFGPTFRAEKSKTRRHLTEFWMLEPEAAFMELDEYMEVAEAMICAVVGQVLDRRRLDLQEVERNLAALEAVQPPFPRLSYDEALNRLHAAGKPLPWGEDLGGDEETVISSAFQRPV